MAKVWADAGDGTYEATDTIVLQKVTRDELVERKTQLQSTITNLQTEVTEIDADIAAIDAL